MTTNLIALAVIVAVIGYVLLRIMRAARSAAEADRLEDEAEACDLADEVDNDIGAMPPDQVREELKRWSRN